MGDGPDTNVRLGRYRLLCRIASGGMGTVHAGRARGEHGFSRLVAIKLMHPHLAEDPGIVARFLEEARIAARVKHPHVVSVLDVGDDAQSPFLVLDYVHGESFESLLRAARRADEPVPFDIVSAIVVDVLEGLHAAHEAVDDDGVGLGIVHRDVSPHNVLVSSQGAAYVTDFGIAKVKDRVRLTGTNDIIGKPGYMSPEQLLARGTMGARSDVYSAGIVLWEALTGKKLFEGIEQQMFASIEARDPFPPSAHRADVPAALDELVGGMLAWDPAARPVSAMRCAELLRGTVPPASAIRVAEWMLGYAQERLDRVEEAVRVGAAASDEVPDEPEPATATEKDPPRPVPRRARLVYAAVATVSVVGATIGFAAVARGRTPTTRALATAEPPLVASASAVAEVATAAASPPAAVAPLPSPSPRPVTNAASRPRLPAASAGIAAKARCAVPYDEVDGIKHWKRECLTVPR